MCRDDSQMCLHRAEQQSWLLQGEQAALAYLAFSPASHAKFCSSDQTEIFFCLDLQIMLTKSFQLRRKTFGIQAEHNQ